MFKYLASYIKLLHIGLISYICLEICDPIPRLPLKFFIIEIAFTIVNILITKKHFLDIFQIILSLNLTYALIPNNYSFIAGLFFFKIIFVFNAFGQAIDDLFLSTSNYLTRIFKFIASIARFTLVEYLFLGLVMLGYKIFTLADKEGPIPEDYILLYKLVVTATTIGYGDVTPKTKLQIYYFTYTIPFICASFSIYLNSVIPIFGEFLDFITGNSTFQTEEGCHQGQVIHSKIWNQQQKASFVNFIQEITKRQAEHNDHSLRVGHNWIALSANHYQRQIPLISAILQGDEGKELKLKVSSKVRRQFYPKGWIILQAGDISEDLMMVDEGEVSTPTIQKRGYVFNQEGFLSQAPSSQAVTARQFVTIWAISLRDLQQLSQTCSKMQKLLNGGLKI